MSALITFATVAIVWFIVAMRIDMANDSILSTRIGDLFGVGSMGMVIVSALIGGIVAMLGALTGASLRKSIHSS